MAVRVPSRQDVAAVGSHDFFLVEDSKAHEEGNQALAKKLERLERMYMSMMMRSKKMVVSAQFLEKFWTAFLAFNSLVLPTLLVVVLGVLSFDQPFVSSDVMITNQHMMAVLVGFSMVFGLPFYMYSLNDLEDVLEKQHRCCNDMKSRATQTTAAAFQTDKGKPICRDCDFAEHLEADDGSETATLTCSID